MTHPPASVRAFYCGRSGSGKTVRMGRDFLSRAPRVLLIDQTGEWDQRPALNNARAFYPLTFDELLDDMATAVRLPRWWIVAPLNDDEMMQLKRFLMPPGRIRQGPAAKLGGIMLCLDEVDRVMQYSGDLRDLWRRGRHAGLSVVSATQRPGNVSKEVTAQCDVIAVLALHEPRDAVYLRDLMGDNLADQAIEWARSAPYRVAYYFPHRHVLTRAEGTG